MKFYFFICLVLCSLWADSVTKTIDVAGNNENFTVLAELKIGQSFTINSIRGYVTFAGDNKLRDAFGKDQEGKTCNNEGGLVLVLPGGIYTYTTRDEARPFFGRFAEEIIGQEIHSAANGSLLIKAFDKNGGYSDNKYGSYQVEITVHPDNGKGNQVPIVDFHEKLAFHWAPIHLQDCAKSQWQADAITRIDYDGDWKTDNNWDNLFSSEADLSGAVYYYVVETDSHWFINYSFYHPRDWKEPWDIETDHENDLEGILVLVEKTEESFGKLQGVVTCAHLDFYSYITESSNLTENQENIDGKLIWKNHEGQQRFCTYQEAKGHGCHALQPDHSFGSENDYIVYYPTKENPTEPQSRFDQSVHYKLISFFAPGELWQRRFESQVFKDFGVFLKSKGDGGNANTPWTWDDKDDGKQLRKGEMALDPALLYSIYYNVPNLSVKYVYNPFQGIW